MKKLFLIFLTSLLVSISANSYSWGRDGHAIVGKIAIDRIAPQTRDWLAEILGDTSNQTLYFSCNWPDIVREQDQYDPTRPFHYVNLPRGVRHYNAERDCADGRCVTEKIKYFAARLQQSELPKVERIKAFNWLCHLLGDLHQPLHAGFKDDRGGNDVKVKFHGASIRLHQLWDTGVIRRRYSRWLALASQLQAKAQPDKALELPWQLSSVEGWTNESHQLVLGDKIYPPKGRVKISKAFEQQADLLIKQRLSTAGLRLATILTAVHTGQVELTQRP
ncbi:MAG: S1/P1 nuclease [Xanthomonadales bacterium]|nr:S1/P1 nuclease [Xanthomonadales bacterium]